MNDGVYFGDVPLFVARSEAVSISCEFWRSKWKLSSMATTILKEQRYSEVSFE